MTVIIALLGLSVAGIPFLTVMGVAAAIAVAIAVLMSLTLTPALLGFAGWRVVAKRYRPGHQPAPVESRAATDAATAEPYVRDVPDVLEIDDTDPPPIAQAPHRSGFFFGWVRAVTRWPIVTVVVIVGLLTLATVPAAGLRLTLPDAGSLDEETPGRITYDLIAEHFGPGFNGPLIVTGSVIESTDPVGLIDDLGAEIATVDGVASVPLATPNETGDTGIVQVIPESSPDSEETKDLVRRCGRCTTSGRRSTASTSRSPGTRRRASTSPTAWPVPCCRSACSSWVSRSCCSRWCSARSSCRSPPRSATCSRSAPRSGSPASCSSTACSPGL